MMATPGENLRINGDRLWSSIHEMAEIGPGVAGGSNRQTVTDEDAQGRKLFQKWCEDEGLIMGVDQMGTMFMRREGTNPDALPVYVGSHLDTQPTGGRYDGVLGVLAGLEIVRTLNDLDIKTKHPIVVTNWTNEEGTRFAPAMMASGVFAKQFTQDWAYAKTDADGKTFGEELERIGWKGDEEVGSRDMRAFFELHIEQGPILEAENIDIGVVTHGQGLSWTQVTITGKDAHTGSTPMPMRKNAGLGMARVLELVDEIAWSHKPDAVGAAGHIEVFPNSRNVIPGKVVFTVDFRSPELDVIKDMENRLAVGARKICDEMGLEIELEKVGGFDPVEFDDGCVTAIRNAAERLGYSHRDIVSGAGHDACWINRCAPTAMVMCPCVDGLSHNEAEEISKEWSTAGAEVLFHAVVETAEIVS
ncbi:MAG: Zn-dependent hydrolase [Rhizobiaceae bacterium]|nr:Zn-dependent hydrolase [Rhizobiaceae bacterium]